MPNITPALFVGHGSPFNLFEDNEFTKSLRSYQLDRKGIDAIVVISAHWLTKGTYITLNEEPPMIYDYYNFPSKFYQYKYECKGAPEIAKKIMDLLPDVVKGTSEWGVDHAATIVLENLVPERDIPILEMSLDYTQNPEYHFELGKKLKELRKNKIIFIGSGNLIHTFREVAYKREAAPFEWALQLDKEQKEALDEQDYAKLIHYEKWPLAERGFQSNDHYLPMLYISGMRFEGESLSYIYEGIQHGSVSHRSFEIKLNN